MCGFETNDGLGPNAGADLDPAITSSGATFDSTLKRTGGFSAKCNSGAGNVAVACAAFSFSGFAPTASTTLYARAYLQFTNLPGSTVIVFKTAVPDGAGVKVTSGGVVQLWDLVGNAQIGSNGPTLSTGTWYCVELSATLDSSGIVTSAAARIDGTSVASGTVTASSAASGIFGVGWNDAPGANMIVNIDDCALNDSTGAVNNSWCGPGGVVLLVPTADTAVGTGWTTSAAVGTGLSVCVDNLPPTGIADTTSTAGRQIRNATSNANVNYDATMTTYTAAGVSAGATIAAVIPYAITAAASATSPKLGTLGVASNPAIANISLNSAGVSGAFYSGAVAGTYPAGWKGSWGTVSQAPAVTLGTAPVMRLTQVTASTRIAICCQIAMYVDYIPAASGTSHTRTPADTLTLTDLLSRLRTSTRTPADTVTLTDSVKRQKVVPAVFTRTLDLRL